MSTSLTTIIKANLTATLTGNTLLGARPSMTVPPLADINLANGTAASQSDLLYAAERTLSASASENLDLAGGSLKDPIGNSLTFAKVRAMMIEAAAANTNTVVVGGHDTAAWKGWFDDVTDLLVLNPGDRIVLTSKTAGKTVTATTADLLKVLNGGSGTSVTYSIVIIGTSA